MPGSLRTTLITVAGLSGIGSAGGYYYFKTIDKESQLVAPVKEAYVPKHYDRRPFQLLSKEEIDKRLRSGQFANQIQVNYVKAVYTNQLPSNNPVEDTFSINTFQQGLIAGVYDGHIGPHCSKLIRQQLPIYMARELNKQHSRSEQDIENAISTAFVDLDQDIQQRFYDIFPKNLKRTTEKDIQAAVARQPDQQATQAIIDEAINGSCALTVYLKDGVVYSANTGDSRVVIISQDEDGSWKGRRLVEEESPANPDWRAHMISQHPSEESNALIVRNRIFGLIAVGGSNYRTPPYLSSRPLVSRHKLQKGDKFIVLGTDGLWDELSWYDVRSTDGDQVAAEIMSRWKTKGEMNPATHLVREALLFDAVYKNVRAKEPVENEEFELSKRLTRQPSRYFRDDITVTVIELGAQSNTELDLINVGPVYQAKEVEADVPRLADPSKKRQSWFSGWAWSRL
ncbi:hypothetical protein RO3G_04097 [Rhizopus delemar RA 99-880]|uniref:PPM-type phosphatase domain-containing protein n=1 Tax=Rhizopus delemar (strain RA 99-880 / ATCC MYA-4621 / FGSC 9543 / NRRL 43880) TaxID=246409 RepID=I1BT62_RHIO9|nr:hypothetical protein RO3G_04097 [Rhizopus delemar RA 99-880]|eukprot:EIE79392.1 hypothetical protein RO3G_04097 [Rhizopus delemar RA 99-880]